MIKIKNAYENNLKNISLNIPLKEIISVIGVSGSGKSTLIYNILANESKRREKIDSGNANCFDYALRAGFDKIDNLPYCVTFKQRGLQQSISSTLATITQLHELLREEFIKDAQIVTNYGTVVRKPNEKDIKYFIERFYQKEKFKLYAIVCFKKYTDGKKQLELLKKEGIKEAIFISSFDNKEKERKVASVNILNNNYHHTILVPFKSLNEIDDFKELALESFLIRNESYSFNFGYDFPDNEDGTIYQKKSMPLLSFNSTREYSGKCDKCFGHGMIETIEEELLFSKDKKLDEHFININLNKQGRYEYIILYPNTILKELKNKKINLNQTYFDLTFDNRQIIKDIIFPKILTHKNKPSIGKFVKTIECPSCNGTRLNYKANAVKLYGLNISEMLELSVNELYDFFKDKNLHHKKILDILKALQTTTLGYLSLNRTTDTLSGGELQRLKFAIELNSNYNELLYIFDEPSTGLHPYNNYQMMHLIKILKDKGNTVIISEHNLDYVNKSDFIIELGPNGGENGGEVLYSGESKVIEEKSFLRKKQNINLDNFIEFIDVNINNISHQDFKIPLNSLVAISGISGSGKSSFIHKVLVPTIKQFIADKTFNLDLVNEVKGIEKIKSIIELTQSQIGVNSRSIVATYLNIFDLIRDIYSNICLSKEYKFDKSFFSFNSSIGACNVCKGLGEIEEIICPSCLGQRFKPEVLDIKYFDLNIFELLNTEISKLKKIFNEEKLNFAFNILEKLGLSHISLGRTTPTLSGGEAQRLKLAKTLIESFNKVKKGNFLFILDEPTTGLNSKDVFKIYSIFDEIISYKNSIIIIEHNLEIIRNSDYIIDIGIGSGKNGGKNIYSGSFEGLLSHDSSFTAKAFNNSFEETKNIEIDTLDLSKKVHFNKKDSDCNKFYLNDNHFGIEKDFAQNYSVTTDNTNHKYFKNREELFNFVDTLNNIEIFFNPYTSELFKYKVVPISIKKDKIKYLKKLGFNVDLKDYELEEWSYRVNIENLEKAYNFGNGWLTIKSNNIIYELFTRLVSLKYKIVGSPIINEKTFNLYFNSCIYCDGKSTKQVYDRDLIIADKTKSVLDKDFFVSNIKINLKNVVNRFKKEKLFDFTKPFNELSLEEQNIFLFGFREHSFLKPNGKTNIQSDYIIWKGIYSYIYHNLSKIKIADEIKKSQHTCICPFCKKGFKKEVIFFTYKNKRIIDFLD
jgi:excinuclease ABC subunit A